MNKKVKKAYRNISAGILSTAALTMTAFAAAGDDTFNSVIGLIQKAVLLGGGLWTIWGLIVLGGALKDHNGPQMQAGIWQIVGGGLIITGAALFGTIVAG